MDVNSQDVLEVNMSCNTEMLGKVRKERGGGGREVGRNEEWERDREKMMPQ